MNVPEQMKKNLNKAIAAALEANAENLPRYAFSRNTPLTAENMVKLLLSMRGGSLNSELHDAGMTVTKSAFSRRRKLLSSNVFEDVLMNFNALCTDKRTFKGYRVLAIDGTAVNMPRNPKAPTFMQNASNPKGYNQFHVNPLYDVMNKTYYAAVIQPQPKMDEIGALMFLLAWYDFDEKTLIVADRGYESYAVFAELLEKPNVDFLIRVRDGYNAMKPLANLPKEEFDRRISFTITTSQAKSHKDNGYVLVQNRPNPKHGLHRPAQQKWWRPSPYPMTLRVVRILLDSGEYETLVTSLPDSFTADDIRELYHARWGIETAFRELKYGLGLLHLHGKSDEYVRQEIWASMIMANLCNRISGALELPARQKAAYAYRVNETMAIKLVREFYRAEGTDGEKLMREIARYTEPVRPGRADERNLKAKGFVGFCYRVAA